VFSQVGVYFPSSFLRTHFKHALCLPFFVLHLLGSFSDDQPNYRLIDSYNIFNNSIYVL